MSNKIKDRHLPIIEYLEILQKEYLICDFRRKIYFAPNDKRYYKKVMDFKKEKILGISQNNGLSNILDDKEYYSRQYKTLFDENGKPLFELSELDSVNYFNRNAYFKVITLGRIGKLLEANFDTKKAKIVLQGSEKITEVTFENISRIL